MTLLLYTSIRIAATATDATNGYPIYSEKQYYYLLYYLLLWGTCYSASLDHFIRVIFNRSSDIINCCGYQFKTLAKQTQLDTRCFLPPRDHVPGERDYDEDYHPPCSIVQS